MDSSILFLGTGGDSFVVGRHLRGAGGIVLKVGSDQYHIDPGPGALTASRIAEINPRATTAVCTSHNHINHANDVNAVIDAMTYGGFDKRGVMIGAHSLFADTEAGRPFLLQKYLTCVERAVALKPGNKVGINTIEVTATKALHDDPHAIGFTFNAVDFSLGYTGDTAYSEEIADQYKGCTVLILNVPFLNADEGEHNLSKEEAITFINRVKPKLAIITHFGNAFMKANPTYEVRELQQKTASQVICAKDGLQIDPTNYGPQQVVADEVVEEEKEVVEENASEVNDMIEEAAAVEEKPKEETFDSYQKTGTHKPDDEPKLEVYDVDEAPPAEEQKPVS